MSLAQTNGRGRPTGTTKEVLARRGPRLTKWRPRKWKPVYDKMILLACHNWSNTDIAAQLEVTPEHVSNVLNLPESKQLINQYIEKARVRATESISERLERVATRYLDRIEQAVESDELFDKSPFAVIDRGLKLLDGVGKLRHSPTQDNRQVFAPTIILSDNRTKLLTEGVIKADEAKMLHEGQVDEIVDQKKKLSKEEFGVDLEALALDGN